MSNVVSHLLKVNLRARSKDNVHRLLCDVLGGTTVHDRGTDTIGSFEGSTVQLAGVTYDVVVPTDPDGPLAKVIDKHGEGIDSICYAVDDMDRTRARLKEHGIEFSRLTEFHGNKVGFVHPRDACGVGLEFIQGPVAQKTQTD